MVASVSICVPAYNAGRTLDTTLRSILGQDVDVEVVVLDNASGDDTGVIAHSIDDSRMRVIRNDVVLSIGDNWNKAVALSTGRLVKVVCADDILLPGSLESQMRVMDDRGIAISSARFDVIDEDGGVRETGLGVPGLEGLQTPRSLMRLIVRRGPADFGPTAAAMFRRENFDSVGGFRGDLVFPMDVDLFARVCVYGMFFGMLERVAAWRDSTFNLCSQTSTYSKLSELLRFHHRIAHEYPDFVTGSDVLAGDMRLVRAAFARVVVRTNALVPRHPDVGV